MNYNAHSEETILNGVKKFGPAPGGRKMMDWEFNHANEAIKSGLYVTYYCEKKNSECSRIGSNSMCFCRHFYKDHKNNAFSKKTNTSCEFCPCKKFAFVPQRPEEVGEWWLPRRKDFDINKWRAKCKCNHAHEDHKPNPPHICAACGNCFDFRSNFECISCDCLWEEHIVLYETEDERILLKKPVGDAYLPLNNNKEIQNLVFFNKPKSILDKTRPAQIKNSFQKPITNEEEIKKKIILDKTRPAQIKNSVQKPITKEEEIKEMKIVGASLRKK